MAPPAFGDIGKQSRDVFGKVKLNKKFVYYKQTDTAVISFIMEYFKLLTFLHLKFVPHFELQNPFIG